jgi:hypothetical protein
MTRAKILSLATWPLRIDHQNGLSLVSPVGTGRTLLNFCLQKAARCMRPGVGSQPPGIERNLVRMQLFARTDFAAGIRLLNLVEAFALSKFSESRDTRGNFAYANG